MRSLTVVAPLRHIASRSIGVGVGIGVGAGVGGGAGATVGTGVDWIIIGGGAICSTHGGETISATVGDGSWSGSGVLVGDGVKVGAGVGEGVGVVCNCAGSELGLSRESVYTVVGVVAEPPPLKMRKPTLMMLPHTKATPRMSASHLLRTVQ
ncbi:hypothetical protein LCGC14_0979120 [marine sediment metagenome]|uniref:Uncharacterized protein n=1 Tax=marine sediment metagenome TaxID=412755 RepID=A0A0F9NVI7_9ZZZZ